MLPAVLTVGFNHRGGLLMYYDGLVGRLGAAALAMAVIGCGGGADLPELVPVSGKVTLDGQPVAEARVSFEPEKGAMSSGRTDAEGHFEVYYAGANKGAIVGKHKVKISKMDGEAGSELIPPQFNEKTTLSQEVSKAGPNEFTFDLKKK
jgi:hypothetical protein